MENFYDVMHQHFHKHSPHGQLMLYLFLILHESHSLTIVSLALDGFIIYYNSRYPIRIHRFHTYLVEEPRGKEPWFSLCEFALRCVDIKKALEEEWIMTYKVCGLVVGTCSNTTYILYVLLDRIGICLNMLTSQITDIVDSSFRLRVDMPNL